MRIFKDSTGREWQIAITAADIFALRETCKVDLSKFMQESEAEKLSDFFVVMEIVYQLCRKQADEMKIDREGFLGLLAGDYLDDAVSAFHEELLFFSRHKKNSAILDKLKTKNDQVREKLLARIDKELETMDADKIAEQIATGSSKSSTPTADTSA